MNNEKFSAIMGLIVPEVIRLITENYPYDEVTASREFLSLTGLCKFGTGGDQAVAFQPPDPV